MRNILIKSYVRFNDWGGPDSDWLRAGRTGDRIPVGARFSAPVQTGPGAHPASSTMGTGSFPGVKSGWCVTLTSHLLLVPWPRKGRAIPLVPLLLYGLYRASVPLRGCTLPFFMTGDTIGPEKSEGERELK